MLNDRPPAAGGIVRKNAETLGVIAGGGVLGAEARYGLTVLIPDVPWATLLANASGCLLIGVLMVVLLELTDPHRFVRPFLGIGVLGGFTTFSAYAVETVDLFNDGQPAPALAYLAATPIIALTLVWAGAALARTVIFRRRGGRP
jgi:CrcB protein